MVGTTFETVFEPGASFLPAVHPEETAPTFGNLKSARLSAGSANWQWDFAVAIAAGNPLRAA